MPSRLTALAPAPANRSVPVRQTIRPLFPVGSAAAVRHWPVKGSHRACRRLSSARWYPGLITAAAPANGRTAACFRREVPGKVLPREGWTGSSESCRCGSGFPLRERVHGSDGTSLDHGLVAGFGFWHPSFPVVFVPRKCLIISSWIFPTHTAYNVLQSVSRCVRLFSCWMIHTLFRLFLKHRKTQSHFPPTMLQHRMVTNFELPDVPFL